MFKNPFSFNGRIRRLEFGLTYLIYMVCAVIISITGEAVDSAFLLGLLYIPLVWFFLAQGAKRCHDRGNSGWYQIIPFYVFWMLFADSELGENEYGQNPKGLGNTTELDELAHHLVDNN